MSSVPSSASTRLRSPVRPPPPGSAPPTPFAQLGKRALRVVARLTYELGGTLTVAGGELLLRAAELHRDRADACLSAVVQVALDPLELQARRVDRTGARLLQALDTLGQVAATWTEQP